MFRSVARSAHVRILGTAIRHPEGPMIVARPRRVLPEEVVLVVKPVIFCPALGVNRRSKRGRHIFAETTPRFVRISVSHSTFRRGGSRPRVPPPSRILLETLSKPRVIIALQNLAQPYDNQMTRKIPEMH